MSEIYTIFDHSYDNDNYDYTSFELFKQYQYKSECTIFIYSFFFVCQQTEKFNFQWLIII